MNNKFGALVLCLLLSVSLLLGACGNAQAPAEEANGGTDAEYVVKVVDGSGAPYTSGIIVQFMKNGEKVALQTIDANGVAAKTLAKGDYTVELMFTGNAEDYFYEKEGLTLSATQTELEVVLAQTVTSQAQTLHVDGADYNAYHVAVGSTHVKLTAGERNYFLFTPTVAGTYEFSVSDATAQLGYYGSPFFVQSVNSKETVDGKFTESIKASMIGTGDTGTTVLVLGIDAGENDSCVLTIERIGEPQWDPSDEPWQVYQPTVEIKPYSLPAGANLMKFDITAATDTYKLVLNETDGFYHLDDANGPVVLMYLGEDVQYLDCFKTILEHSGIQRYFFDENGEFLRKESYNECLMQYIACMDEAKGVYPLTEDLKYILQMEGEDSGWFDTDNSLYLFKDENGNYVDGINNEISWLFMCCYIAK